RVRASFGREGKIESERETAWRRIQSKSGYRVCAGTDESGKRVRAGTELNRERSYSGDGITAETELQRCENGRRRAAVPPGAESDSGEVRCNSVPAPPDPYPPRWRGWGKPVCFRIAYLGQRAVST